MKFHGTIHNYGSVVHKIYRISLKKNKAKRIN